MNHFHYCVHQGVDFDWLTNRHCIYRVSQKLVHRCVAALQELQGPSKHLQLWGGARRFEDNFSSRKKANFLRRLILCLLQSLGARAPSSPGSFLYELFLIISVFVNMDRTGFSLEFETLLELI